MNNETHFKCGHCLKTKKRGEGLEGNFGGKVRDMELCDYCFYVRFKLCQSCNDTFAPEEVIEAGGRTYCKPCSLERTFHCSYCDQEKDKGERWQKEPEQVCHGCRQNWERERNPRPIEDHYWKPRPRFRGTVRPRRMFFGFELEVDANKSTGDGGGEPSESVRRKNEDRATKIRESVKDDRGPIVYCKRDGSVPQGFEVVSHPFTWGWLVTHRDIFDPIFALKRGGLVSHDSGRCGMHVHMSRDAFTPMHLFKFLEFFQKHKQFIMVVSQRGQENNYARIEYTLGRNPLNLALGTMEAEDRYRAVNLSNDKTIEVRIFRGTLKKERFLKNLEFCESLYEFTMVYANSDCTLENYIKFVWSYKGDFPNLYAFLVERYKFAILHKDKTKPPAIRFSGLRHKELGVGSDMSDEEWEEWIADVKKAKEDDISKSKARRQKQEAR